MSSTVKPDDQLTINPDILDSQIDEEVVILNMELGKYFGLNPIASCIWEKLKNSITPTQIISELIEEYDVEEKQCREETLELLESLLKSKLIILQKG